MECNRTSGGRLLEESIRLQVWLTADSVAEGGAEMAGSEAGAESPRAFAVEKARGGRWRRTDAQEFYRQQLRPTGA